jgi:hypothetical protein
MSIELIPPVLASAAAGAFVGKLTTSGIDWLIQLVGSHSKEVQKQVQENMQNFLVRLAKRVEILESELPTTKRDIFDKALNHPATSLLIQKSFISASITENDDRHEILSELIAQRLTAEADDTIALIGSAACDIICSLSSVHIRILGFFAKLYELIPTDNSVEITEIWLTGKITKSNKISNQELYDDWLIGWWRSLDLITEGFDKVNAFDLRHLIALSCIVIDPIKNSELSHVIAKPLNKFSSGLKPTMEKFEAESWWPHFKHIWDIGGKFVNLTSTGFLIGILYHDSITKKKTNIKL